MRSSMPASSVCALPATFRVAATMAPRLRCRPCTVRRYHWMLRPGQPSLLPQGGNQADDVDAEPLPTQRHAVLSRWGQTAASAPGTGAGQVDVLGYLRRNLGQLDDLPSALGPTPRQLGSTVGTLLHRMLHLLGWLPVDFGLQTRHPPGTAGFGLPCQLGKPNPALRC